MSFSSRRARRAIAALLLPALAACSDKITGGASQVGAPALTFGLDPSNARGAATGSSTIRKYQLTSLASTLGTDAFRRSGTTGALIGYGAPACPGLGGTACFNFAAWLRDPLGDERLPRIEASPAAVTASFCDVGGPEYYGASSGVKAFEIYCRVNGLKPNTPYSLRLVRYGLQVRGTLDAVEKLVFGRVSEPDSLVLLNPNPAGAPGTDYEWLSNLGCNNNAVPVGANPFELGTTSTGSTGRVTFDKCFASGNLFYKNGSRVVPDSAPFFRNSTTPQTIAQQYNYLEITEGSAPGGPVAVRIQVGADLDPATGVVIPNSFAPFPTAALSPGVLISTLKVAEGGPSVVRATVLPLEPLAGTARYKVLLVDRVGGKTSPAKARYWTVTADTTGRDAEGNPIVVITPSADTSLVTEINGAAANVTHVLEVADSLNSGVLVRDYTDLALVPPAAGSKGAPIWANYRLDPNGTANDTKDDVFTDNGTVVMGTLPFTARADPYVFRPGGSASGTNRGSEMAIALQHLPRPPVGFVYAVWLLSPAASDAPLSLGGLHTPLPEFASLDDADTAPNGGVLTSTEILAANVLLRAGDFARLGSIKSYRTVRVTLEAKDGVPAISPIVVLEGPLAQP
jgi:hypothetical protein